LGLCRVYLESATRDAFERYVEHELDMHQRLLAIEASGQSLKTWQRQFLLDVSMRPTRDAVLSAPDLRSEISEEWSFDHHPALVPEVYEKNREHIISFASEGDWDDVIGHSARTVAQRHVSRKVSLERVISMLALQNVIDLQDSLERTGLLIQLSKALENDPDETCEVFMMRPNHTERRKVSSDGITVPLFQGRSRKSNLFGEAEIYPGDRSIHDDDRVSLQVHLVDIDFDGELHPQVPMLAIWVPNRLAAGWVVQGPHA